MEDHLIDEVHTLIYKTDIADQTAKIVSIETFTLDQTQTEVKIQTILGIVLIHSVGKNNIPMTVQEKFLTTKIEIFQ